MGNDAVDQLSKFNQRLIDLAPPSAGGSGASKGAAAGSGGATDGAPHAIDGILLTKFDTIDDKVRNGSACATLGQVVLRPCTPSNISKPQCLPCVPVDASRIY